MQKNDSTPEKGKRFNKKAFYSITGTLTVLMVIAATLYINHMNYWPYNNDKIRGLPDEHIRAGLGNHSSVETLLFSQLAAYEMNYSGSEVKFYAEHYHYDERPETIGFGSISRFEGDNSMGQLIWGLTDLKTTDFDENPSFGHLYAHLELSGSSLSFNDSLSILPEFTEGLATSDFIGSEPIEIKKNQPIPLLGWSSDLTSYSDYEYSISPDAMADREDYIVLYLEFK
ncbi:hypothetical protein [Marinilactibacillus sp. Marseille-P9653]|uniref:hypothetical protein n=1 Tax=Marinilactibacillus sp. Marseille-P9653 TaxID=2866583 RepID=UPI001CE3ECBC|nr:hypothetical protein [Marinilactibacillus sp. Marseille-P9653]